MVLLLVNRDILIIYKWKTESVWPFFSNSAGKAQMVGLEVEKENYITVSETELGCELTLYQCVVQLELINPRKLRRRNLLHGHETCSHHANYLQPDRKV